MTKEQKIEAFALRLDGYSYKEIAEQYGMTKQNVEQSLRSSIGGDSRRKGRAHSIYKGLNDYMVKNDVCLKEIGKAMGHKTYNAAVINDKMKGTRSLKMDEINGLIKFSKKSYEDLFLKGISTEGFRKNKKEEPSKKTETVAA